MNVIIDVEHLLPLIQAFYELSGIKIAIYDNHFTEIMTYPENKGPFCSILERVPHLCQKCDDCAASLCSSCALLKRPNIYNCHAGLTEVAAPLMDNDIIIGYVIYGQITNEPDRNRFVAEVLNHCAEYGLEKGEVLESINHVRYYSNDQLSSTLVIINALISYIILKRMIYISKKPIELQLIEYIENNLYGDLSVPTLCKKFAISKSALYNCTKTYMPEGIAKYVRWRRLEAAKDEIMKHPEKPLWKVAEETGFEKYDYFLRLFKTQTGTSAVELKKQDGGNETYDH